MSREAETVQSPQQDPASETGTAPGTKRCSRCGETKELGAFAKHTASRDGLQSSCKACVNARHAERILQLRTGEIPYVVVTEKVCPQCEECLPATAFTKHTATSDGLQSWCKVCHTEAKAARASRLRTGEIPYVVVTEKVCPQCEECLPATAFTKHTATSDGLQSWCKACGKAAKAARASRLRTGETPYVVVAEKVCSQCEECLPATAFGKYTSSRDGLQPSCKACGKAAHAARASRLRTSEIPYVVVTEKVCTQCEECLPATAFVKNTARSDGLASSCKACHTEAHAARASRLRTSEIPYVVVTEKVCTQCEECLPATAFVKNTARSDGLDSWCKACDKAAHAARASRLRTGEIPYVVVAEKVCSQCEECLPATAFGKQTASSDGLQSSCKVCDKAAQDERKRQRRTGEIPYIIVTEKVCTQCEECLPATAFVKNTARSDGLDSWCKACAKAADAAWKLRDPLGFALTNRNKSHRRRARERNNGGNGFTKAQLYLLAEKQGATCPYCATYRKGQRPHRISLTRRASYHIDHVVPIVKGGTHDITNLILCCPECNLKKQAAAAPVPVQTLLPLQNLQSRRVS